MKFPQNTRLITLGLLLISAGHCAVAQENARLPYKMLYQLANPKTETLGEGSADMTFKVTSKNPEIKPSQISAHIESGDSIIPVPIAPDGTMLIPLQEKLLSSNSELVANQPKGSLNLEVIGWVEGSLDQKLYDKKFGRVRYSIFFPQSGMYGEVDGFTLESIPDALLQLKSNTEDPSIRIGSKNGMINVQPNDDGVFRIEFSEALLTENPWVYLTPNWFSGGWKFDTAAPEVINPAASSQPNDGGYNTGTPSKALMMAPGFVLTQKKIEHQDIELLGWNKNKKGEKVWSFSALLGKKKTPSRIELNETSGAMKIIKLK